MKGRCLLLPLGFETGQKAIGDQCADSGLSRAYTLRAGVGAAIT